MTQNSINNNIGSASDATVLSHQRSSSGQWDSYDDQTDSFGFYNNAGTPQGVVTANIGSRCVDTTNGNLYIKQTDSSNTGWVLVADNADLGWIKVQTSTPSGGVIICPLSTNNRMHKFVLTGITTSTNNSNYVMDISINNQSTWIVTGYIGGMNTQRYNSATLTNFTSTTFVYIARTVNFAGSGSGAVSGMFTIDKSLFNSPCIGQTQFWDNNPNTLVMGQIIAQLPNPSNVITDIRIRASHSINAGSVITMYAP